LKLDELRRKFQTLSVRVELIMASSMVYSLHNLRNLLKILPSTIPTSALFYNFNGYAPNPDKLELYGSRESVLNQTLEVAFAPRRRKDGDRPFKLLEQGPGLVAVVDVLQEHLVEFSGSPILTKWVEDFTKAASSEYISAGILVSRVIVGNISVKSRKFTSSFQM
jgi:hypothetical protein